MFQANILFLRESRDISIEDIATFLGISTEEYLEIELTGKCPSMAIEEKLADLFCVTQLDLFEKDLSLNSDMQIAFRATGLSVEDFFTISHFNKVLKNYIRMDQIQANADSLR